MESNFPTIRFGDLLTPEGTRNGVYKGKEFHGRGQKIINMGELFGNPRLFDIPMKRVELDAKEQKKFLVQPGDLLFARRSLVAEGAGKCCLIKEVGDETCFESSIIKVTPSKDIADSEYIFYLFTSQIGRHLLGTILRQTAVSGITGTDLVELEIPFPALPEQKAIAHILGTLDDKIELNRKTNETLEGIAKALFKSWFVDFDPVRAKAEGRPTGLPDEIGELFPDSFEESELGEIPSGWKNLPLGDLYEIGKGGVWGDDSQTSDSHQPFACLRGIDCHSLSSGRLPSVPLRYIKDSHQKGRDLQQYTILVEGSGSFCGRSLLWEKKYEELIGRRVIYSNFCKRLDPLTDLSFSPIAWMGMRSAYESGEIGNYRTGSAFPNLDMSGVLMNLKVVIPSIRLAEAYETFFSLSKRLDPVRQSNTLSEIRDALLPRLISGELRVPDAEKMLEEVGI